MSIRDIKILALMHKDDKTTPYKSMSFDEVFDLYSNNTKNKAAKTTIRNSIKTLLENGYIENGYKRVNMKTYFITDIGIKLLSELE